LKALAIATTAFVVAATALITVPLLFGAVSPSVPVACGGSGSIDGHAVPAGVEAAARTAALRVGVDELVLLAVTYRETHWGQARAAVPDDQALAWLGGLATDVDRAALGAGGASAVLVGRPAGVALGDWIDPIPVGTEHAIGFAQFLPSTWSAVAGSHPRPAGGAWDPYSPPDALTLAGYYLAGLLTAANGDVDAAVRSYGTADFPSALAQLRATWRTACAADVTTGDPFGGLCRPKTLQAYSAIELFTPDGRHHGIDIACQVGATEFSVTAGVVFDVASGCPNGAHDVCGAGYGNHVVVRFHGRVPGDAEDHDYFVIYGHLLTTPLVGRGQQVQPGTPLGQQGDSGLSWGSHLHFEVDRDAWNTLRSIDPSVLLPSWISRTAQV
jgi:murein DD-endopeptidase MepM/ murein hydrolase activator NlpD